MMKAIKLDPFLVIGIHKELSGECIVHSCIVGNWTAIQGTDGDRAG